MNGAREMTFKIFVGGERVNSNAVLGDAWRQADARDSQKRRFDVIEPNILDQACGNAQATGGQKKRAT